MKVSRFVVNYFEENTYLLWDENSRQAVAVDPGMMKDYERDAVTKFIDEHGLSIQMVLVTHMHIDHVMSARWMASRYGCPLAASLDDAMLASRMPEQVQFFRLRMPAEPLTIDHPLADGDVLLRADEEIHVLASPGHSPGGLCFYLPQSGVVVAGDTLFAGGVGRVDLPGGDMATEVASIKAKLLTLPDETMVLSGHGDTTTIGQEKQFNPYLR